MIRWFTVVRSLSMAGTYYCFVPQLLFYNIGRILEQWIQEKDKSYFETTYQDLRGRHLETKALEYLGKILPGAQKFGQTLLSCERRRDRKEGRNGWTHSIRQKSDRYRDQGGKSARCSAPRWAKKNGERLPGDIGRSISAGNKNLELHKRDG